jgi:L-rhamnose mutarotase
VGGYFETTDLEAARAGMAALDVNSRWQAEMAGFFADAGPDERLDELTEVFHLETQLARVAEATDQQDAGGAP